MSRITAGAVVDVTTPRGLRPAIVSVVDGENFQGYLIDHNKHFVIQNEWTGLVDEIVADYPDERGVVITPSPGEGSVIIFKDEEGVFVCNTNDESRGRFVKSVPGVLKIAGKYLEDIGAYDMANDLRERADFYGPYLASLLDIQE